MKKILIIILSLVSLSSYSQSYYEVLQKFISNSPQLKQYKAVLSADSLSLRRGLNPVDPSVEFEHFFDNGFELSLKQQFDFPTLYHQRNMMSKKGVTKVQLEYKQNKQNLMIRANDLYQGYVYYSEMIDLLKKRSTSLSKLDSLSKIALSKGAITALEFQKTNILKNSTTTELNNAENSIGNIVEMLRQMGVEISGKVNFETFDFNGSKEDFAKLAMLNCYAVEALKMDSVIANHQLKLSKQEWIPKFELGYKADFGGGAIKHGIVAGISLPLWGNRNNVKHAKAQIKANNATISNVATSQLVDFLDLYDDYFTAKGNCQMWQKTDFSNYTNLIEKSIELKSITSMEYLLELTAILDVQLQILNEKYAYALNGGRMAVYIMTE